jgi:hypothetical protein
MRYFELAAIPFQSLFCLGYGFIGYLSLKQTVWPLLVARVERIPLWISGRAKGALPFH